MQPALPPLAWSRFTRAASPSRDQILAFVNRAVNHAIDSVSTGIGPLEDWHLMPKAGPCHDYAVTKRHILLALGFAPSELLLCECIAPDGEHHLVLRVGLVVLDNLTDQILPMHYPVVRQQSSSNPDFWESP